MPWSAEGVAMTHAKPSRRLAQILSLFATLCLVLAVGGCSNYPSVEEALEEGASAQTVAAGTTLESGVLTVGINANSAPYAWPTSDGAALQGIDVDVALAMGEEMGLTVKFVNVGTNYEAAANGTCDVVMGTTSLVLPTSEVLIGNYLESAPAVFAKNATSTVALEELAAAGVGVQADSVSARTLAEMAPTAALTSFDTLNDAFAALEAGTVSYVACDSVMGGYLATGYTDIDLAGALALADPRGVAVSANNVELQSAVQAALDAITSNGVLRSIRESWVGDLPSITSANQVVSTAPAATDAAADPAAAEAAATDPAATDAASAA